MEPKKLRWPAIFAAVAAALLFAAPASASPEAPALGSALAKAPECASGTTVTTDKGTVCGTVADGVKSWLGIRYAAPPVDDLRWAPPAPAPAWNTTFAATEKGNNCPQADGLGSGSTIEDCLNLNVRAPANAGSKRLPVMVQIHGGGFRFGTPADGSHLVRSGDVISVEVHYRLGIFGFMAHDDLGRNSGNYAFQDQQAALRWVQRNITRFGGDPHNVTIFGASAGGSSVCANTVSPTARGLFQKGIVQSGEYNSLLGTTNTSWQPQDCKSVLPTAAEAHRTGERFAAAVGCGHVRDTAACLRRVPVQTLLDKSGDGMGPDQGTMGPIVDGRTLTMSMGEAITKGRVNNVTLIHGVDRDETQLDGANTPADYRRMVQEQYGRYADKVFKLYPLDRFPEPSAFIAYRTIIADSNSVCPSVLNARRLSRHLTVYAYQSDDHDAPPAGWLDQTKPNGAYHVLLNQFLSPRPGQQLSPNQQALGAQVTAQWTGFAHTGNPTVKGAPLWPRFTRHNPDVMALAPAGDSQLTSEIGRQHNCGFWDRITPYNR
ncbi:carboxylesterase family protein [Actinomadura meridiana]|uniref:Carboxylic ester hydrolase n=1 Tax=Actinomadura meridiana TaxID=559626 RepID=A0ABP8C1A4_9ACTN